MKSLDDCYVKLIEYQDYFYRLLWSKDKDYFTLESEENIVLIFNRKINDLTTEIETLREFINENREIEKQILKL